MTNCTRKIEAIASDSLPILLNSQSLLARKKVKTLSQQVAGFQSSLFSRKVCFALEVGSVLYCYILGVPLFDFFGQLTT